MASHKAAPDAAERLAKLKGARKVDAGVPAPIIDALVELLAVEESEITRDSKIREDLGADSLDVVEIVLAVEEQYGITIDEATGTALETGTVGDLVDVLAKRGVKV